MLKRDISTADPIAFSIALRALEDGTGVITATGELDLSTAPRLKWILSEALEEGSEHIVVDLSGVGFMDSTALGVLLGARRKLDDDRLAVVCSNDHVLQIFRLSGTDRIFAMYPTLDEALAHVRRRALGSG